MAASTPKILGIVDQLVENFEAMVADTSHYVPDKIYKVVTYQDRRLFDSGPGPTFYAIRPGDSRDLEHSTGDSTGGFNISEVEMFVLAARYWGGSDDSTDALTIRENLIRDVKRVLFTDPTVDGLAINVSDGEFTVNRQFFIEGDEDGWVCAEFAFPLSYTYHVTTP